MSKDQAARIAERARETVNDGEPVWSRETIAKDIRRAIASAVRKERERCVEIVKESRGTGEMGKYERSYMCDAIVEKINGSNRPHQRHRPGEV